MLESSNSPIPKCNCNTLIHEQGSKTCRYERPIRAKTQIILEELLLGTTRRSIAHKLNMNLVSISSALEKVNKLLGTNSAIDSAKIARSLGWLQQ